MDIEKDLKLNIFSRAKIFIEKLNELAPFGAKYTDDKIVDVIYDSIEENTIDSQNGVAKFIDAFSNEISTGQIEAAAVAYDVSANFKNADGVSEKRDALCIRVSTDGTKWSEDYYPYMIIDGECVWR